MLLVPRLLKPIVKPVIETAGDLRRYVALVTATATTIALAIDVTNQLTFFSTWSAALWSWTLTVVSVAVTAVPISMLVARAQRDLHRAKRDLEILSRTDVLTGLPNRRALMERVEDGQPQIMILVIVDIDRFKAVNDVFGHRAGDAVISAVGRKLATALGGAGMVGRLGGEEFAVLAPSGNLPAVLVAMEDFRRALAASPLHMENRAVTVSVSAGVAIRTDGDSFDRLYIEADEALYRAKSLGRNRIELSLRLQRMMGGIPRRTAA